jgi:4-amino-4-deoxy-L-arabinose transferase-like glycosyltransferase
MRFYKLNALPPGLHPDEAANGLDIFRILEHHDLRVIYSTNGPREALFFYLQTIGVMLFGNTILALRVAPAMFGVLAVLMVYLLTKELFGRRAGLIAALLMAVNPWVVIISRDGFRASLVPFFVATLFYAAARAYRSGKLAWFIIAGATAGLGMYTYTAYGAIWVAIVLLLVAVLIWRRKWWNAHYKQVAIAAITTLVVLLPLVVTIVRNPADSTARAGGTSFLNSDLNQGKPLQTLAVNTYKSVVQYNITGDQNSRHNIPSEPLLNVFVGIAFIIGLLLACVYFKQLRYSSMLAVLAVMILPAAVSAESLPHALRSIGTAVPVFVLSGVGINYMLQRWYQTFPLNTLARVVGLVLIIMLLGLTVVQGVKGYFWAWGQDPRTYSAYSEDATAIAKYLNSHVGGSDNYLVAAGYAAMPVEFLTHNKAQYKLL